MYNPGYVNCGVASHGFNYVHATFLVHSLPAAPSRQAQSDEVGGTPSKHAGTHRALWVHTCETVPQLACCPDLLRLVLEGGGGEGARPLPLPLPDGATFVSGSLEETPT